MKFYINLIHNYIILKNFDKAVKKWPAITCSSHSHDSTEMTPQMIERKITEDEYLYATFGALAMFVAVYVFVLLISCVLCVRDIRAPPSQQSERGRLLVVEGSVLNGARNGFICHIWMI